MKPWAPGLKIDARPACVTTEIAVSVEHHRRHEQRADRGDLDLARLDLLAELLGRPPDHQAGDEDGDQDVEEHPVEARSRPRRRSPRRGTCSRAGRRRRRASCASWPPLTEPFEASVVATAQIAVLAMPKRTSLSAMLPPAWPLALREVDAGVRAAPASRAARPGRSIATPIANIANIAREDHPRVPPREHHACRT